MTTRPRGAGESPAAAFLCWFLGCAVVYSALFGVGYLVYGRASLGVGLLTVTVLCAVGLFRALPRVGFE